jgi:phospholipase A2
MGAARLLRNARLHRLGAAAGIVLSASHVNHRTRRTFLDSPSVADWPQDTNLIAQGRRSLADKERREAPDQRKEDQKQVDKTNDPDTYPPGFEDDDASAWDAFSRNFNNVREGMARIEWSGLGGQVTDFILPKWARELPNLITKLQFELNMGDGSLADEIWREAQDPDINPEILWDAKVRVSGDLCKEEYAFLQKRKQHVVRALATYLDLKEEDVHPDDVPTIAMCGSGGGLRALVAGTSSYLSSQEAGLWDCVTYTAGVSGSCWLQTLYFSSMAGQSHHRLIDHLKHRLGTHIAYPPDALKLVTSAPTNKFLLSGFIEKLKGDPGATFGLVDIYGGLLAARLLVPNGDLDVQATDLKLSNQQVHLKHGKHPMPIYTAVRHEIPVEEIVQEAARDEVGLKEKAKEKAKKEAWFQWFELSPYEVFCEEFGAGIPSYALGRPFEAGRNKLLDNGLALPELRTPLMLGIYGSAFCATLSHYYKEVRPLLSGVTGFGGLDSMLEEKNDDLIKVHPIEPATIPNFAYKMQDRLPESCPESIHKTDHLQLMDAGMSNNLPIYPLLRPGRNIDILVAFDASADIQKENWLSVVDGYAKQRGIMGWPVGSGWPRESSKSAENALAFEEAQATSSQEAASKIAAAREKQRKDDSDQAKAQDQKPEESPTTGEKRPNAESELGYCTVWVGSKQEREADQEPPPSKRISWNDEDDTSFHLTEPDAGITVIYFPLFPNPKVEGVDPDKTDFMSTWNFIYTPEQIDKVVGLARSNFDEGAEQTKRTVRAVYERKKRLRRMLEDRDWSRSWKRRLREEADHFSPGSGMKTLKI